MNFVHPNFDRLDLNLLKVFEVVHRERSLSRAADVLSLTPSAVSHALRRLRDHFGDPLFERVGHEMVPTPLCIQFADDVVLEMARLRAMMQRWDHFDPSQNMGKLTLGMPDALEGVFVPDLSQVIFAAAPKITLVSAAIQRRNLALDLQGGKLDVAIDVNLPVDLDVFRRPLFRSSWCIVARSDHPVIRIPTLANYENARHVVVSSRSFGAVLEEQALAERSISRDVRMRCQSYMSAIGVLAQTSLVLTMPRGLAKQLLGARPDLRIASPPVDVPDLVLFLYWHKNQDTDRRSVWIRDTIVSVAADVFQSTRLKS